MSDHSYPLYIEVYHYDAAKDPWLPVRRLLTCPHCGLIGRHKEQGDPHKAYARLEAQLRGPIQCAGCREWSITGNALNTPKRYPKGQRVDCPPYRIPQDNDHGEER